VRVREILLVSLLVPVLVSCAQPGYHYETGSFTAEPDDLCQNAAMSSPGAIAWLNTSTGDPLGVPGRVVSIGDLRSPDLIRLASIHYRFSVDNKSMNCHATLSLEGGGYTSGVLTVTNPGAYAPMQVKWLPDEMIAARLAVVDGLTTGKKLLVVPDLDSPEIQKCVGRQTALGMGEEFPGQAWAVCKDKLAGARK